MLEGRGHDVVPISRSVGVDVVTGEGLAEALAGVETVIDAATVPSPEEGPATEFFTASARNLQTLGERAGVQRIVVVSIIGIDRFTGGYQAAKQAQEQTLLAGPIPVRILRAAQFHEFVPELVNWGRQDGVSYLPKMRTQLVAARSVAEALADLATLPDSDPQELTEHRSRRSPVRARRASTRWRDCSSPIAAIQSGSKASSTQPWARASSTRTVPTARPARQARRPELRGVAKSGDLMRTRVRADENRGG